MFGVICLTSNKGCCMYSVNHTVLFLQHVFSQLILLWWTASWMPSLHRLLVFHKLCSVSGNLHRSQIGECYNAPTFKDSITPDFTPDFSWESHEKKRRWGSFNCSCYVRFPLEVFYCLLVATCKGGNLSSTVFFNFLFIIYAVHFSLIYQQTV